MITHSIGADELQDDELAQLESQDVVEVWYNYEKAPYEGSGYAVVKFEDGTFDVVSLSHCSCYGPTDNWSRGKTYSTLADFKGSQEYFGDIDDVCKAAGLV